NLKHPVGEKTPSRLEHYCPAGTPHDLRLYYIPETASPTMCFVTFYLNLAAPSAIYPVAGAP
ncbi:MAG: hypothetical protein ACOYKB_07180, partial [Succiniclasticum sp.]